MNLTDTIRNAGMAATIGFGLATQPGYAAESRIRTDVVPQGRECILLYARGTPSQYSNLQLSFMDRAAAQFRSKYSQCHYHETSSENTGDRGYGKIYLLVNTPKDAKPKNPNSPENQAINLLSLHYNGVRGIGRLTGIGTSGPDLTKAGLDNHPNIRTFQTAHTWRFQ